VQVVARLTAGIASKPHRIRQQAQFFERRIEFFSAP
jgi:hypothetical protein